VKTNASQHYSASLITKYKEHSDFTTFYSYLTNWCRNIYRLSWQLW